MIQYIFNERTTPMKNIWIDLAQENKHKRHVNQWLGEILNGPPDPFSEAMYSLIDVVFRYYETVLVKDRINDRDDVRQECMLAILNYMDGVHQHPDGQFSYLVSVIKARLQTIHRVSFDLSNKDLNRLLEIYCDNVIAVD